MAPTSLSIESWCILWNNLITLSQSNVGGSHFKVNPALLFSANKSGNIIKFSNIIRHFINVHTFYEESLSVFGEHQVTRLRQIYIFYFPDQNYNIL